jgi:RNA polymerase sigma-70 factor (ECF subfamily)
VVLLHSYDGSNAVKRDDAHVESLAERFHASRPRLQRIAQRILGSAAESEDAIQETWLRISRAQIDDVENVDGWLTTVLARVCFDALKWRKTRREDLTPDDPREDDAAMGAGERPEEEALLADSIGVAMRVLLDALPPAERMAFVLHDMFDVPFDTIGTIVGRTTETARQLASRGRRRVRGTAIDRDTETRRHDELVRAFLAASRVGNFAALLALLDPAATLRADDAVMAMGGAQYWENDRLGIGIHGADDVARSFSKRAKAAQPAFIDGQPGAVWMHEGRLQVAFRFTIRNERIAAIDLIASPDGLAGCVIEITS